MNILGFLAPVVMFAILIAIVVAVIVAARRSGEEDDEPGIGTLRRVFYYLLGFIGLGVAASGLSLLIATIIEPLFGGNVIVASQNRLALALALTLGGTPIWLFLWGRAQQSLREYPVEARTLSRKLYLYLVLGISAGVAVQSLVSVLGWAFRINADPSLNIALLIVMAGVWVFHWRADAVPGAKSERGIAGFMPRLYVYVTALYGLALLASGSALLLYRYQMGAYEALLQTPILGTHDLGLWSRAVREHLSMALVGGVWWWTHWRLLAGSDRQGGLRQVYLYIFAVFGGAVTVVVSAAMLLYGFLFWLVRVPGLETASEHFRFMPGVTAGLVVGAALWGYHYAVIKEELPGSEPRFIGVRRVYEYLVSAVGLGTLAVGLVIAFASVLGQLVPRPPALVVTPDEWKKSMVLALTLITVGAPLWGYFWFGVQREAGADPIVERGRLSRRVFIYAVFGIALLLTLGNLSNLLFTLLRDLLNSSLGSQSFQDARWFSASLLMAGAVSVYYGLVMGEDRRARDSAALVTATSLVARKRVTALVPAGGQDLVRAVEAGLGYSVTWWRASDGAGAMPVVSQEDLRTLPARIAQAPSDRVLLLIDTSGVRVLPYDKGPA